MNFDRIGAGRDGVQAQNWINVVLGIWLFLSPWVLASPVDTSTGAIALASWNFWIVGAIVAISAGMALQDLQPWEEWVNLVLAVWLFFSPWILGFSMATGFLWNALLVGVIVAVTSGFALPVANRMHPEGPAL